MIIATCVYSQIYTPSFTENYFWENRERDTVILPTIPTSMFHEDPGTASFAVPKSKLKESRTSSFSSVTSVSDKQFLQEYAISNSPILLASSILIIAMGIILHYFELLSIIFLPDWIAYVCIFLGAFQIVSIVITKARVISSFEKKKD